VELFNRRKTWICSIGSATALLTGTLICAAQQNSAITTKERSPLPMAFTAETIGDNLVINAMNNNGDITGSVSSPDLYSSRAFLWSHGKMIDIGGDSGRILKSGLAMNDRQQILCEAVRGSKDTKSFPVLYENGTTSDLRRMPGGRNIADAYRIDRQGSIVGHNDIGETMLLCKGHWQKFPVPNGWVPNPQLVLFNKVSSPIPTRIVINNAGDSAGTFQHRKKKESLEAAFQGMTYDIKPLPGSIGTELVGMSDTGIVAGNSYLHPIMVSLMPDGHNVRSAMYSMWGRQQPYDGAFIWTAKAGTQALPAPDGYSAPTVHAISPDGDIVGTSQNAEGKRCITLWRDGKAVAISNLFANLNGAQDIDPIAINDGDQICVRVGERAKFGGLGKSTYYRLSPLPAN